MLPDVLSAMIDDATATAGSGRTSPKTRKA
jgi:hypothetical protein